MENRKSKEDKEFKIRIKSLLFAKDILSLMYNGDTQKEKRSFIEIAKILNPTHWQNTERDLKTLLEALASEARKEISGTTKDNAPPEFYFERNGDCLLTSAGVELIEHIGIIERSYKELLSSVKGKIEQQNLRGVIFTIASITGLSDTVLPKIISLFIKSKTTENCSIKLLTGSSDEIKEMIRLGIADVGLVTQRIGSSEGYISKEFLIEYPRWIYAKQENKSFDDYPYIYFIKGSSWRERMDDWIGKEYKPKKVLFEVDSINNLMLWVNQGIGKSIVPSTALDKDKYPNIVVYKTDDKPLVTRIINYKTVFPRKQELINAFYECSRGYFESVKNEQFGLGAN